jgi:pimeloyl-ACP methyl ester carboxylesterase
VTISTRLLGKAASAFDRAVIFAVQTHNRRARGRTERLSHEERMARLALVRQAYGAPELIATPDTFFAPPPPLVPALQHVRDLGDAGELVDASWPSASVPYLDSVRAAYLAHEPNRIVHARLYLDKAPRPAVVLIHGYLGGSWTTEGRAWPIDWMRRCGLDVAIPLLPFHALRGGPPGGPPPFPGPDPRFTNEGFRQAVSDIRALIRWLRARGAPAVGVMGMSLGGYTTSLLATVEEGLAFAVPIIPLASIADFARDQRRLGTGEQVELQHRALEEANWVVSPFARKSLVSPERMLVVGAEGDRITPIAQAERLARHFGAPLYRMPGGHLLQVGRGDAFREMRRLWQRLGLVRPR